MHDLLEGVCHLVAKLALLKVIFSKDYDISLDTLNNRISDFSWRNCEQWSKPSTNFTRIMLENIKLHKIKQKADQAWNLMITLPSILSDIFSGDDKYLQIILILNQILQIIFAPVLKETLKYVGFLIYRLEDEYRELFGSVVDPINKLHNLAHYADCSKNPVP